MSTFSPGAFSGGSSEEETQNPQQQQDREGDSAETEQVASDDKSGDESGSAIPTGDNDGATPGADGSPNDKQVPYAAYRAEKSKRQEYERRIDNLEGKIEALMRQGSNQPQQTTQEPEFDPETIFDDPKKAFGELEKRWMTRVRQREIEADDIRARHTFDDYDDVLEQSQSWAAENPSVARDAMNSPAPAFEVYKSIKKWQKAKQQQNGGSEKEAELRKQLEEITAEFNRLKSQAEAPPPSAGAARGVTSGFQSGAVDPFKAAFKTRFG